MFKKKTPEANKSLTPASASQQEALGTAQADAPSTRRCTVIAENTLFTGDIHIDGNIHIYGKFHGNINLTDGLIHVMRSGLVEGELTAPEIIIDGRVEGTCTGDEIEILEHGIMEGVSRSAAFSIRPGGCFIGTSERIAAVAQAPEQVVKIKKGQAEKTEAATVVALAQGE